MARFSSIQVTPRMRLRLQRYKTPGASYEDVLKALLDAIPPEEFRAAHDRRARARGAALGRRDPALAADESRALEAERIRALSPAERMNEAYRLFRLFGGTR